MIIISGIMWIIHAETMRAWRSFFVLKWTCECCSQSQPAAAVIPLRRGCENCASLVALKLPRVTHVERQCNLWHIRPRRMAAHGSFGRAELRNGSDKNQFSPLNCSDYHFRFHLFACFVQLRRTTTYLTQFPPVVSHLCLPMCLLKLSAQVDCDYKLRLFFGFNPGYASWRSHTCNQCTLFAK